MARNGKVKGHNCRIIAAGWGTYHVIVTRVFHGINMVYSEDRTRTGVAFYMTKRTSGSFGLDLVFPTYASAKSFSNWFKEYGKKLASPNNRTVGVCRVVIPSHDFDKVAVPAADYGRGTIPYGDSITAVTYPMTLQFVGSRDPIAHRQASRYVLPGRKTLQADPAIRYFHPAGKQLKGQETGTDSLYSTPRLTPRPGGSQ